MLKHANLRFHGANCWSDPRYVKSRDKRTRFGALIALCLSRIASRDVEQIGSRALHSINFRRRGFIACLQQNRPTYLLARPKRAQDDFTGVRSNCVFPFGHDGDGSLGVFELVRSKIDEKSQRLFGPWLNGDSYFYDRLLSRRNNCVLKMHDGRIAVFFQHRHATAARAQTIDDQILPT